MTKSAVASSKTEVRWFNFSIIQSKLGSRYEFALRGKAVLLPANRAFVSRRGFVMLEPPVCGQLSATLSQPPHLLGAHRREAARDAQVLSQHFQPFHPADHRSDRQT